VEVPIRGGTVEHTTSATGGHRSGSPDDDERIDEMVEESFPASDPPTGWAGEDLRDILGEREDDGPPER
jgi:hypothetical protein